MAFKKYIMILFISNLIEPMELYDPIYSTKVSEEPNVITSISIDGTKKFMLSIQPFQHSELIFTKDKFICAKYAVSDNFALMCSYHDKITNFSVLMSHEFDNIGLKLNGGVLFPKLKPFAGALWTIPLQIPYVNSLDLLFKYEKKPKIGLLCTFLDCIALDLNVAEKLSATISVSIFINKFLYDIPNYSYNPSYIEKYEKEDDNNFSIHATSSNGYVVSSHIYEYLKNSNFKEDVKIAIDNGLFVVGQYNISKDIIEKLSDITPNEFFMLAPLEDFSLSNKLVTLKEKPLMKPSLFAKFNDDNFTLIGSINGHIIKNLSYSLSVSSPITHRDFCLEKFYLCNYGSPGRNIFYKNVAGYLQKELIGSALEVVYSKPLQNYAIGTRFALLSRRYDLYSFEKKITETFAVCDLHYVLYPISFRISAGQFLKNTLACQARIAYHFSSGLGLGFWGGCRKSKQECGLFLFIPYDIVFSNLPICLSIYISFTENNILQPLTFGGADLYDNILLYHNARMPT